MAARKQRSKGAREGDIPCPSDPLPPARLYLPRAQSTEYTLLLNSPGNDSTDEYSAPMIQSSSSSVASEHVRLLGDIS